MIHSIYEGDLRSSDRSGMQFRSVRIINPKPSYRIRLQVNPGKRPERKPGQSPAEFLAEALGWRQ